MSFRPPQLLLLGTFAAALVGCGGGGGHTTGGGTSTLITGRIFVTGLNSPMQYVAEPGQPSIGIVLERAGKVRAVVNDVLQFSPALDISAAVDTEGEGGLLGLAFDPQFTSNHFFYLNYTSKSPMTTRVVRFTMNGDGISASPASAHAVFSWNQAPYDNHKGGAINFGLDGLLYLGLGDGGSENDPHNRAQDPQQLFGKMLRIDPASDDFPSDPDNNYHVPADNPFVGESGVRGEIWDFGLRNPFRWTFDGPTGALIIADVGQDAFEELDYEPASAHGGRNYGWRQREGFHDTGNGGTPFPKPFKDPFLENPHPGAEAIIGGYVYNGSALPAEIRGRYLFGDEVTNRIWSLAIPISGGEASPTTIAAATEHTAGIRKGMGKNLSGIVSISPDANGEPIVVELSAGRLTRLVAGP